MFLRRVCLCVCSHGGMYLGRGYLLCPEVPTLTGGTYLAWGAPTLVGGGLSYLSWRVPTLDWDTYLGQGYLPLFVGYLLWGGYLPWPGSTHFGPGGDLPWQGYLPWRGVPTLDGDTYLERGYLTWMGMPTLDRDAYLGRGYLPWCNCHN